MTRTASFRLAFVATFSLGLLIGLCLFDAWVAFQRTKRQVPERALPPRVEPPQWFVGNKALPAQTGPYRRPELPYRITNEMGAPPSSGNGLVGNEPSQRGCCAAHPGECPGRTWNECHPELLPMPRVLPAVGVREERTPACPGGCAAPCPCPGRCCPASCPRSRCR